MTDALITDVLMTDAVAPDEGKKTPLN